jgi:Alpha/beta hydrolase domain
VLPWFMPSAFVPPSFDLAGDHDLNADGGVRLPHVRTKDFGGPLGLYRGLECNNPKPLTDALACPLVPAAYLDNPDLQLLLLGGSFVPYTALGAELSAAGMQNPCDRYRSHDAYVSAVKRAAKYAVDQRWVLSDEVDPMVAAAEESAAQYPGCAPAP